MIKQTQKLHHKKNSYFHRIRASVSMLLVCLLSAMTWLSIPLPAHAVAKTWDGGCGANTNWSCANNWSGDTVPASGDTLTFNATSTNNSTADTLFNATETISSLTIAAGYTGTITLATTLHISGNYSQATGTFTAAAQTFDMNGSFTLSGGIFTASSSSTTLAGAMTISGVPTFNNNGGIFTFDGSTTASLSCNSVVFNTVTIVHTSGTKTVGSNCSFPVGNNPLITVGVVVNGAISGTGTLSTTSGTLTLGTTGVLSGFDGIDCGGNLTINGTLNSSTYSTFSVTGSFALGATSVFTAPASIMSAGSVNFTVGSTFNANGGTLDFTGNSSSSACASAVFNLVTFHNTATKTIGSDCSLPLGNNPTIANSVTTNGTLSGTGTLTTTTGTLTIGTTGALSGFSGINTASALTINGTLNAGLYGTFTIGGALTLGAVAVFTAPSGTINLTGSLTITAGATFNANGGTLNLTVGTGTLSCANVAFNLVTINGGTNIKTVNSDCNLPLGNNPSISRVVLNGTLSGTGTLTHTASTFQLNAGATFSGFSGFQDNTSLIIAGATLDANSFSSFNVSSALTVSSGSFTATTSGFNIGSSLTMGGGTFTAPSGTLHVSGLNISGGTFVANGGIVDINDGTGTLTCGGVVFNLVTFSNYGPKTINAGCTLPLGSNPTFTNTGKLIFNGGTVSGTGNLTIGADIDMLAGNPLSGFDGLTISNADLVIGSADVDLGSLNTLVVGGSFNQGFPYGGPFTFTAPSGVMHVGGDFYANVNGTTFDSNGGTIVFEGTNGQNAICGNATFNLITLNKSAGYFSVGTDCSFPLGSNPVVVMGNTDPLYVFGSLSGTGTLNDPIGTLDLLSTTALSGFSGLNANNLTIDGAVIDLSAYNTLDVNGNFLVTSTGNFTTTSANMTVGGNFTIDVGSTFDANGGTVVLDGSNQIIQGTTFNNLTKIVATADALTLPAGVTETILGTLILKGGDENNLLSLISSDPGVTQWQIDAQGAHTLQYLNVVDSNNINAATMVAYDSVNGGNNTNWQFTDTPIPPSPIPSPTEPSTVINNVVSGTTYNSTDASSSSQSVVDIALKPSQNGPFEAAPPPQQGIQWWVWVIVLGLISCVALISLLVLTDSKHPIHSKALN